MRGVWIETSLGDVLTLQRGYDLPQHQRRSGDVPVISSSGVTGFHDEWRVRGPGVVTGRYGTLGEVYFVTEDFWPLNTTLFVRDFNGNDPRFIFYLLQNLDFSGFNDKSSVPGLNRNHLHQIPVKIPSSIADQQAIAHVLGTLDDKIDLNRRLNRTLEETARALFRSWFVDFDPVRAKAARRQPAGMDAATAALFPSALVASEMGEIPEGWLCSTLGELAVEHRDGVDPTSLPPDTPYFGLEHIPRQSIAIDSWGTASEATSQKLRLSVGDILFGRLRPYFHKIGLAPVAGICSTDIIVVRPRQPAYFGVVLGHTSSPDLIRYSEQGSEGTRMPRVAWSYLAQYPVAVPPVTLADAFNGVLAPILDGIRVNLVRTKSLAELRNTLLPLLFSGELRPTAVDRMPA